MALSLQILFILLSPIVHYQLGLCVFKAIRRLFFTPISEIEKEKLLGSTEVRVMLYVLGLLSHLAFILFSSFLHLRLPVATFLPVIILFFKPVEFKVAVISGIPFVSINFCLWFVITLLLGVSLFDVAYGVRTPWVNNYGDLTWHIGMITSFVHGENIPPQMHLLPGTRLNYPFFTNLWTAGIWSLNSELYILPTIFTFQWVVVWLLVYVVLNGNRYSLLPWVVLFGGGSYAIAHKYLSGGCLESCAHTFIDRGFPWTPFISTVWVTQRPTLLGLLCCLTVLRLFHNLLNEISIESSLSQSSKLKLTIMGLVLSFSILAHTHFFLVTVLYIVLNLVRFIPDFHRAKDSNKLNFIDKKYFYAFIIFITSLIPTFVFLPWVIGKAGIIGLLPGWMQLATQEHAGIFTRIFSVVNFWKENAISWFISIVVLFFVSPRKSPLVIILLLFIASNLIKISVWEWDQIKLFIAIYLLGVSYWSSIENNRTWLGHWLLFILIVPGLAETVIVFKNYRQLMVYSTEEIKIAETIKQNIPPQKVILAAPMHNSPVTLSGRPIFMGYDGTLFSHGIKYEQHLKLIKNLDDVLRCENNKVETETTPEKIICPDFLLWSGHEKRYWPNSNPDSMPNLKQIPNTSLYKMKY